MTLVDYRRSNRHFRAAQLSELVNNGESCSFLNAQDGLEQIRRDHELVPSLEFRGGSIDLVEERLFRLRLLATAFSHRTVGSKLIV